MLDGAITAAAPALRGGIVYCGARPKTKTRSKRCEVVAEAMRQLRKRHQGGPDHREIIALSEERLYADIIAAACQPPPRIAVGSRPMPAAQVSPSDIDLTRQ